MKILQFPNEMLFTRCHPIDIFDEDTLAMLKDMYALMIQANGIGLSANQVGITRCMFTMRGAYDECLFILNPRVIEKSEIPAMLREGCLSAPGDYVVLKERPSWVKIAYQDEKGVEQEKTFHGIHAVCVMHEMDHLLGKTHLQSPSLNRAQRKAFAKKWGI